MILLRILKNDRTAGVMGWIIITVGLFLPSMIRALQPGAEQLPAAFSGMPFYNLLFGRIHTLPFLNHLIALAMFLLIGWMLIRINVRYILIEFRSVMPAVFFVVLAAAIPSTRQMSPPLAGTFFFMTCLNILFDVREKKPDTYSIFSASLVLALGSMFYLKLIWFVPLIWVSLITLRNPTWRELLYPVVAYLILGLSLFTWHWGVKDDAGRFVELIGTNLAFKGAFQPYHYSVYILYGYFFLLILLASIYMVNRFQSRKTAIQVIYQVLFYIFVAGLLFFLLIARFDADSLVFIALPVSYILSFYFHRRQGNWLLELALWLMVGLLVFVQWMR